MAKAQSTYDEIKQLQKPFTIYPDDTILLSHRGIAKIINLEELSEALSKLMVDNIAKQIYDSLAKVAHTGSYYDLIDVSPNSKKWIFKAPNGTLYQLDVDNNGDLYITKAKVPISHDTPIIVSPNGKWWKIQVDNEGDMNITDNLSDINYNLNESQKSNNEGS